jgi:hypothetical protein
VRLADSSGGCLTWGTAIGRFVADPTALIAKARGVRMGIVNGRAYARGPVGVGRDVI